MLIPLIALSFACSSLVLFVAAVSVVVFLCVASKKDVSARRKDGGSLINREDDDDRDVVNYGREASIFGSEDIIGGSPFHLPQLIGPTATSFNFHVYAPPSVHKEIPKIDIKGTLDFITTGKVRKFVPIGAKRLLVINLVEMTLEVHVPRKTGKSGRKHRFKKEKKKEQGDSDDTTSFSDVQSKTSTMQKPSGINISTKKLVIKDDVDEDDTDNLDFEEEEEEESWSPRHFEAKPKTVLKLENLISVSALSPVGVVVEILSVSLKNELKIETVSNGNEKKKHTGSLTKKMKETHEDLVVANEIQKWWNGSDNTPVTRNDMATSFVTSTKRSVTENVAKLFEESIIVGTGIDEATDVTTVEEDEINTAPNEVCSDEFVFRTSRDAVEFQRIVMSLRTCGREIQQLYEALETIQANSEAHFPTIAATKEKKSNAVKAPIFVSPGVALDDAWRCLNDVKVVNTGLSQYRLYSQKKSDTDEDIIAAAANDDKPTESKEEKKDENGSSNEGKGGECQNRKELCEHYQHRRALLGIRDFFSLFVPPLPLDSPAIPYGCPCVASESMLEEDSKFSGVEVHIMRLRLASALQLRVGSAALYVRAYARAKAVVQEGWQLDLIDQRLKSLEERPCDEDTENKDTETNEDHMRISPQNITRLAYDNEKENLIRDVSAQNESYEPATYPSQGYMLVGWHKFAIPSSTSDREKFWLRPDKDPIETIPSLRQIVAKHPDLHFCAIAVHNDHANVITCYLFVRSLPVGIDESFDETMDKFINSSAKERDKLLELRLQVAPGHSWSSLAKVAIQFFAAALFGVKKFHTLRAGRHSRISFPGVMLSNVMKLTHFGGSLRQSGSLNNYVSCNAHLTAHKASLLFFRNVDVKTCTIDYALAMNADNSPGRVLSVIRMVNVDANQCVVPSTFVPNLDGEKVEDEASVSDHDIEPTSGSPFWNRVLRFGTATRKLSLGGTKSCEKQDELYSAEIDIIYDVLDGVTVPIMTKGGHTENKLVRLNLTRSDIERFVIACEIDLNAAVTRIIKSTTWRMVTFPIDTRLCRVELESGQFFHQGKDKQNNPIFYFRNMLLAPWSSNVKSTMLMILHRLETFFSSSNSLVKVTVIILTGFTKEVDSASNDKSNRKKKATIPFLNDGEHQDASLDLGENDIDAPAPEIDTMATDSHIHSNFHLVQRLCELLSFHYPERLNKALVVPSKAFPKRRIYSFALSPITKSRVVVLNSQADLKKYVAESELISGAGGAAKITSEAFKM